MILVTVGTQRFQFNRLLSSIDNLMEKEFFEDEVFAQIGYSTYSPKNFKFTKMISSDQMEQLVAKSSMIITHSGTSSIITGLKEEKKIIVVPRQKKFGEHVDNHQIEIAQMFEKKNLIEAVYDLDQLEEKIILARSKKYKKYIEDSNELLMDISKYIELIL